MHIPTEMKETQQVETEAAVTYANHSPQIDKNIFFV